MEPEGWQPLLENGPSDLRGVALYNAYDLARSDANQTLDMLRTAGVYLRMEQYSPEGHVFPADFQDRFRAAVKYTGIINRPGQNKVTTQAYERKPRN